MKYAGLFQMFAKLKERKTIMEKLKIRRNNLPYIVFAILSLFSLSLIFNNNVWFDEAYTLSLIQHNYAEVIKILETDMHPPLYFISLKAFCEIFGYSIMATKMFSVIGYIATLLLGCTVIKKHFGSDTSKVYMLTIGAIPMSLYFSVQQRSYQWCIFFVTLCFIEALLFIEKHKTCHCILFVVAALFAAYNHIYALLAVGVIFAFVNIYIFLKNRKLIKAIILADISMIIGYLPWLFPLLHQAGAASDGFWLTSVEPLSVIVFVSGIVISALILAKKENRSLPVIFAIVCVLSVQAIGLAVTIFISPFYIARYSVVILGIFGLLIAFGTKKRRDAVHSSGRQLDSINPSSPDCSPSVSYKVSNTKVKLKKAICILLCVMSIACFVVTGMFEYNSSMSDFFKRFNKASSSSDIFVYCDNSFGIMSYYYPQNTHICTYRKAWFDAFDNIKCIDKNGLADEISPDDTVWFVKNELTKTPQYIESNFELKLTDTFQCDFNTFELYSAKKAAT